ncbi:MAG: hypothetical protein QW791_06120 [Candidatus Bathyarchaeia archaeon]
MSVEVLYDRWFWIIVISITLIVVVPLIVVWSIFYLPPELKLLATICIVILWGVASGYKDWVVSKGRNKEENKK